MNNRIHPDDGELTIRLLDTPDNLEKQATVLFGGDFCPRGHYEQKILSGTPVFSKRMSRELAHKDCLVVNLESPLWNTDGRPGGMGCAPQVATHLRQLGIDMVGFANNHALDRGDNGMRQTLRLLKENNIVCGGAGENRKKASRLTIIRRGGLRIGIWCIAEKEYNIAPPENYGTAYFLPEANVLEIARFRRRVDFLAIFVHAGHEFMLTPSPRIRDAYRSFIDAGADLVIGHHPHVPQGWECHNGKWIFYSLGNLVFDSPYVSQYKDTDWGYLVRARLGVHNVSGLEIIPYRLKTPEYEVAEFTPGEFRKRRKRLEQISAAIVDDRQFEKCWTEEVIRRWNGDYRKILASVATAVDGGPEEGFALLRNILWCPTHREIVLKALELRKNGQLKF